MVYTLNGTIISDERASELINDLAMFPRELGDYAISVKDRKVKYITLLMDTHKIQVADNLFLRLHFEHEAPAPTPEEEPVEE